MWEFESPLGHKKQIRQLARAAFFVPEGRLDPCRGRTGAAKRRGTLRRAPSGSEDERPGCMVEQQLFSCDQTRDGRGSERRRVGVSRHDVGEWRPSPLSGKECGGTDGEERYRYQFQNIVKQWIMPSSIRDGIVQLIRLESPADRRRLSPGDTPFLIVHA